MSIIFYLLICYSTYDELINAHSILVMRAESLQRKNVDLIIKSLRRNFVLACRIDIHVAYSAKTLKTVAEQKSYLNTS